ncbi:hypothetical protein EG240_05060 [Paenimyroides tangerinum]|uniref:Lipocalin-like domain-containing protein n=1 Tax=Paenimyroides tangerinum TaxID=2488728 RepID=A0A3P3W9W5_9FLAO|nr:hypothetical protein [Paenimyroides tangerinum]RRJ91931.1 hypothetical protein EG240_05060 [Paenimyroides tangerinum]
MKKLLFLFVASTSLLVSCGSDDNSSESAASSLIGKWEAKSFDYSITFDGEPVEDEDGEFEVNGVVGTIFEFKNNNIVLITSYEEFDENEGEWTTDEGTYVYNEAAKTITITSVDEFDGSLDVVEMKVNSLTNSNFNFSLSDAFDFEDDETGEEIEVVLKMDVNCIRK